MSSDKALHSWTGGVKSFELAGRTLRQRERLFYPMTDEERRWRAQFVKDQQLEHGESLEEFEFNEAWYLGTRNILRRTYNIPLNIVQRKLLEPAMGRFPALVARTIFTRLMWAGMAVLGVHYYMKYNRFNWERGWGADVWLEREKIYPTDPSWPHAPTLKKEDFFDRGFSKSAYYIKDPKEN